MGSTRWTCTRLLSETSTLQSACATVREMICMKWADGDRAGREGRHVERGRGKTRAGSGEDLARSAIATRSEKLEPVLDPCCHPPLASEPECPPPPPSSHTARPRLGSLPPPLLPGLSVPPRSLSHTLLDLVFSRSVSLTMRAYSLALAAILSGTLAEGAKISVSQRKRPNNTHQRRSGSAPFKRPATVLAATSSSDDSDVDLRCA